MHIDEVRNNLFYQFPQWLLKEPYNNLSHRAMLMYMLLWDRRGLSEKNGWHDENGKVYVYFTNEQFMETLGTKSNKTIVEAKKELHKIGLLEEVQQGVNKPNRLYINGSVKITHRECKNYTSGSVKNTRQDVQKLHGINTNIINTNISKITNTNTSEQNPLEKTPTDTNIYDYYQQRIGPLDGYQYEKLRDYLDIDKMEPELVKKAIDKGADNSKRNFGYVNAILKSWVQSGIYTIAQQDEEQRNYVDSKAGNYQSVSGQAKSNIPDWHNEHFKEPEMSPDELAELERIQREINDKLAKGGQA